MTEPCLLATLPAADDTERLLVLLAQTATGQSRLLLQQQSWAAGVGWFNQQRVELDPQQAAALRSALGACGSRPRPQPTHSDDRLRLYSESA